LTPEAATSPSSSRASLSKLLTPDVVLQRAPELRLHFDSSGAITIRTARGIVECGPHGLAVLDEFSKPRPFADALKTLTARVAGAQDWMDLAGVVISLHGAGVLREPSDLGPSPTADDGKGFDQAHVHIAMLNDRERTNAFLAAIQDVVAPTDVVVDIGTGTGVLAVAAARAGARHVYAIESSAIARSARAMFAANGLADRITLVEGWSTQVTLPERADVLVSEIIGNEPLGERVLEVSRDARHRLLKPGARFVPAGLRVLGIPVTVPDREMERHVFARRTLENWRGWYGIDFEALGDLHQANHCISVRPHAPREWAMLGEPIVLAELDFSTTDSLRIDNTVTARTTAAGRVNGLLIFFELAFGNDARFTTHPSIVNADSSWQSRVWLLRKPIAVRAGDSLVVTYKYRVGSQLYCVDVVPADA
jgi:hypothetical protein